MEGIGGEERKGIGIEGIGKRCEKVCLVRGVVWDGGEEREVGGLVV